MNIHTYFTFILFVTYFLIVYHECYIRYFPIHHNFLLVTSNSKLSNVIARIVYVYKENLNIHILYISKDMKCDIFLILIMFFYRMNCLTVFHFFVQRMVLQFLMLNNYYMKLSKHLIMVKCVTERLVCGVKKNTNNN